MLVVLFFVMIFLGIANVAHKGGNILDTEERNKKAASLESLRIKIKKYYKRKFDEKLEEVNGKILPSGRILQIAKEIDIPIWKKHRGTEYMSDLKKDSEYLDYCWSMVFQAFIEEIYLLKIYLNNESESRKYYDAPDLLTWEEVRRIRLLDERSGYIHGNNTLDQAMKNISLHFHPDSFSQEEVENAYIKLAQLFAKVVSEGKIPKGMEWQFVKRLIYLNITKEDIEQLPNMPNISYASYKELASKYPIKDFLTLKQRMQIYWSDTLNPGENVRSLYEELLNAIENREINKIKEASDKQLSIQGQLLPTYKLCHPIVQRRYKKIAPICIFIAALSFILFVVFGFIFTLANKELNPTAEACMAVGTCIFFAIFGVSIIAYEVMYSQVSKEIRHVWYHKWDEDYKPQIAIMIPPQKVWEEMKKTQKKSVWIKLLVSYISGIILIIAGSLTLGLLINDGYSPTGPTDNAIAMGLGLPLMLIGFCICIINGAIFIAKYVKAFKVVKNWVNENPSEAIKLVPEDCRIYMDDYLNDYFEQPLQEEDKNKT